MNPKNWLYPPDGMDVTFELMQTAALMVINKDKTYPKQQIGGIGGIAKAVYANRIFPFRYKRLFKAKLGQIVGGAISHIGILLVYQGLIKKYRWDQITSCNVTITSILNQNDPNGRQYSYSIYLGFGEEEGFNANPNGMNFFEFGGRSSLKMAYQADNDDEKVAELFALYYNRVRSERLGIVLSNGDKQVNLHYPINQSYLQEVYRRFSSPEGIFFKKKLSFKRFEITRERLTFYKRKKKKIEYVINWQDISNITIAKGASYSIWIITFNQGVEYDREFIWLNPWKPEPEIQMENKTVEKQQRQMILPVCWLNLQ